MHSANTTALELTAEQVSSATHGTGPRRSAYRPDIDGLRAIAICSVVAFHAGIPMFSGGFVGVDVFFVISGFLIGSLIYSEIQTGGFSFGRFYQRRAKRILPALFAVIGFCYVASAFLLSPKEAVDFSQNAIATILSFSNIRYWLTSNYFSPSADLNPLLMTWSLAVEEQFYVFFPILMILLAKMSRKRLLATLLLLSSASFAISCFSLLKHQSPTFYLLPFRAWELGAGAVLTLCGIDREISGRLHGRVISNALSCLGLILIACSVKMFTRTTPFPGALAMLPVGGAVLLILSRDSWINRNLLAAKPIVFVGLVSYSWYLWHWPLLSFARLCCDKPLGHLAAAAIAAGSFGVAVLSYRFVERPFRNSKTAIAPLLRRYALVSAAMLLPAFLLFVGAGFPARFPQLAALERTGTALKTDPCLAAYGRDVPNLSSECAPPNSSVPVVALLGDSHAAALAEEFREMGRTDHFAVAEFTKASCPPLSKIGRMMPDHPDHWLECATYNQRVLDIVRADPAVKTVILAGYWSASFVYQANKGERFVRVNQPQLPISGSASIENFRFGLNEEVRLARSAGKAVIILKDNPQFGFDPLQHVKINSIPLRRILATSVFPAEQVDEAAGASRSGSTEDDTASTIIDQVAAKNPGVRVYDLKNTLSAENGKFLYEDEHALFYVDSQHLSVAGSRLALSGLNPIQ